jgi:rhodanese-related sulfurtransferase
MCKQLSPIISETNALASFSLAIKQGLTLVLIGCALGLALNLRLVAKSVGGGLLAEIQQRQLAVLKAKAKRLSPQIRFLDLVSAKKLFDERQAVFVDARSPDEFRESAIAGAKGISAMSVVNGEANLARDLPNQEAIIITYCSGGECDVSVELAKELVDRGYRNIYVLGEGYPGWVKAGYPVSRPEQGGQP